MSVPKQQVTEADMMNLLMSRYDKTVKNGDWVGKRYMRAQQVPAGLSYNRNRICDFIAMDTHSHSITKPGGGYLEQQSAPVWHGHEIKTSRADWLHELKHPSKADTFKRHMHFWWLVIPDKTIVQPGELPDGWGVLLKTGSRFTRHHPAPLLTPEPMPDSMIGAVMRATVRTETQAHNSC